jgi:hypothetical protein
MRDEVRLKKAAEMNLLSKSQMKKGLAETHNKKLAYIRENKLVPFMGYLYIEEEEK